VSPSVLVGVSLTPPRALSLGSVTTAAINGAFHQQASDGLDRKQAAVQHGETDTCSQECRTRERRRRQSPLMEWVERSWPAVAERSGQEQMTGPRQEINKRQKNSRRLPISRHSHSCQEDACHRAPTIESLSYTI